MTDPIARGNPFRSEYSPTCSNERQTDNAAPTDAPTCRVPSPASPYFEDDEPSGSGSNALVSQNLSSPAARFTANNPTGPDSQATAVPGPAQTPPTNNNAQRTAMMKVTGGHVDAGITSSGDSAYASVAAIKGHTEGANLEAFSLSGQVGAQNEAQFGVARVAMNSEFVSWEVRTLELDVHGGIYNPDGSTGANNGFAATAIASELTVGTPAMSFTFGAAAGPSREASIGTRDANNNGDRELCFRRSVGDFIVVGACVEPALVSAGAQKLYENLTAAYRRNVEPGP